MIGEIVNPGKKSEVTLQGDRRMTVKELAERFCCDIHTITNHANRLFPSKIRNGVKTFFDEKEVTLILESIKSVKSQNDTLKVDLQGTETTLTPALKIAQLAELIEQSHRAIESIKDAEIAELKPKAEVYDGLVERGKALCLRDTAGEIGIRQTDFIEFLLHHRYLYRKGEEFRFYAEHRKYFVEKEIVHNGYDGLQVLVTPEGRGHFLRLLAKNQKCGAV
jgi:phage antirepressor YoqD-like protein